MRESCAQPFKVRITPFRMSKGIMALLSPSYLAVVPVFMTDANESVRDEVAAAEVGTDRAADAVEAATVQEVIATAPKIPVIVQVGRKGVAAEAAAAVAVASTCLLTAVFPVDRGAIGEKTAQRRSEFIPRCIRCTGFGHEENSCSSNAAVLVMELPVSKEDLAVEAQTFAVTEAGKCSLTIGDAVGGLALNKQVVQYIADSAATCNMTPDADGLTNYRECSRPLGLANGEAISIVGFGDLTVDLRTDHAWVHVEMNDVAHVPLLNYNLISLLSMTLQGHTYTCDKDGITLKLNGGETMFFPLVGKLYRQYGYRPEAVGSMVDTACTTIAPGKAKAPTTSIDINILHCTFGHTHEILLKKMTTQQGIAYSGELHECRECLMAKVLQKPSARSTHARAAKKLQRIFVDLSGPMAVQSIREKRYPLIERDDCTRFTRVYLLRHKSDAASAVESFLAEVRADDTPCAVMVVRSDNGRNVFGGVFGELFRKRGVKQEFTPADSPKYHVVAERALGLMNGAAVAARIQATELYPSAPNYPSLWAEAA